MTVDLSLFLGMTWKEAVRRCPKGIFPACHNAEDSVTVSGLKEPLEKFVADLQEENIFARIVNVYGYAFHCEHVWPASKQLRTNLSQVSADFFFTFVRDIYKAYIYNLPFLEWCFKFSSNLVTLSIYDFLQQLKGAPVTEL